jgi:hypothetical protein
MLDKIAKNDAWEAVHQRETAARTAQTARLERILLRYYLLFADADVESKMDTGQWEAAQGADRRQRRAAQRRLRVVRAASRGHGGVGATRRRGGRVLQPGYSSALQRAPTLRS